MPSVPDDCVLLIGHGSREAASNAELEVIAEAYHGAHPHVRVETPPTNIVMIDLTEGAPLGAEDLLARARERGVLLSPMGPRRLRAVT